MNLLGSPVTRHIQDVGYKLQYVRSYRPVLIPCQNEDHKISKLTGTALNNEVKYWSFLVELDKLDSKKSALKITSRNR